MKIVLDLASGNKSAVEIDGTTCRVIETCRTRNDDGGYTVLVRAYIDPTIFSIAFTLEAPR